MRQATETQTELTRPMREALVALVRTWSFGEAAKAAKVDVTTVREWARRPEFIYDVGRCVIGLAENEE
jgi:hypothetical protein